VQPLTIARTVILLSVVIVWGINSVLIKYLVLAVPPLVLQTLRVSLASLFLAVLVPRAVWRKVWQAPEVLRPAFWAAFFSVLLHQICMGYGMESGQAGLNSLILSLNPLAMAVLAHIFLGERLTWRRLVGVVIGFTGVTLMVGSEYDWQFGGLGVGLSELIIFGAMLTFVIGNLFVRRAAGLISAIHFTALTQIFGALMLWPFAGLELAVSGRPAWPEEWTYWALLVASAALGTAYSNVLWNRSIQEVGAARTSMFLNLMPLASLVTANWLFAEAITPARWAGLAAVVTGIYLGAVHKESAARRLVAGS